MGSLRKYLFNGAVISSITSGLSAFRAQRKAPNDWRTALSWAGWVISLIVTIGTVRIDSRAQEVDPTAPDGKGGKKPRKGDTQKVPTKLPSETKKLITDGQKSQKKALKAAVKTAKKNEKAARG
jgi:hypothetical protein